MFARAGVPIYAGASDGWQRDFVEGLDALVDDGCAAAGGMEGVMAILAVSNPPAGGGDLAREARAEVTMLWIMGNIEARSTDSPHNGAVFWSGYEEGNKARARDFAVRTGGKTIEMTDAGRWLDENWPYDELVEIVGQRKAVSIWDSVAIRFAVDASGEANAFIFHMRSNPDFPSKTYMRLEKPALLNNPISRGSSSMNDDPAFERFRRDFLERPQRDGPDVRLLDDLSPADRQRAEQLLLSRIAESPAAMTGLVHLRSHAAIEPLRYLLHHRSSDVAVDAAIALWRITEDEQALSLLIRTIEQRPVRGRHPGRAYAAAALTHIDRPDALAVLIDAVDDRDPIVQANARMAVAERLRLNAEREALVSGHLSAPEFQALARTALARGEDP